MAKIDYDNREALRKIDFTTAAEPRNSRFYIYRADIYLSQLYDSQKVWNDVTTLIGFEPGNRVW